MAHSIASLLKKQEDIHLNLFWFYEGKPTLENNITKAFVNTFESLSQKDKIKVCNDLFKIQIPSENSSIEFQCWLQKKPDEALIKSVPEDHRLLFAFSPTGKAWGEDGIDSGDYNAIEQKLKEACGYNEATASEKTEHDKHIKEDLVKIKEIIEGRGESIPDGWIMLFKKGAPFYCIALENKLYDLDPYQLNNHCVKSLFLTKNRIVYCRYSTIIDVLGRTDNKRITEDFLRYMYYLKYCEVSTFEQLKGMDDEYICHYANSPCEKLLGCITGGKIDTRRRYNSENITQSTHGAGSTNRTKLLRFITGKNYCSEILLEFVLLKNMQKELRVELYFAPTQSSAKNLAASCANIKINPMANITFSTEFHFQYMGTSRNYDESRVAKDVNNIQLQEYIQFWHDHQSLLKQSDINERNNLLNEMHHAGLLTDDEYDKVVDLSNNYSKKLNVVPEFSAVIHLSFDEIQKLEKAGTLVDTIKNMINQITACLKLPNLI